MSAPKSQPPAETSSAPAAGDGQLATAPSPSAPQEQSPYKNPLLHTAALVCTPTAFLALALPPRRLNFQAILLGGTALWGVSQLKYDYTGKSMLHRFLNSESKPSTGGISNELPSDRAAQVKRMIIEEKARRARTAELLTQGLSQEDVRRVQELERRRKEAVGEKSDEKSEVGTLEAIWMGDADKDWKEKRAQKEKEALSEGGEGIWGLITDQISEVFTRGERKAQEEKAKNEETGEKKSS